MVVSRTWLLLFCALFLVPWIITALIYSSGSASAESSASVAGAGSRNAATTGGDAQPWGQLEIAPIVISPPLEYVPTNWGPIEPPRWVFPGATHQQLEQFFASTGMQQGHVSMLMTTARPEPRINGLIVSPDPSIVREMSSEVRKRVYLQLAKAPFNHRHNMSYRHYGPTPDVWLGRSRISPATFKLVEPFVYADAGFLYFSDIDMIRTQIPDGPELQRLAKALLRESTLLVRLHVNDVNRIDALADYWGKGGRRTDIRPLLESLADSGPGSSIDIAHLLPPLARQQLYRYPRISLKDFEKPGLVNCFWTALNFFNAEPDDRLLDSKVAFERLKQDYYIVHDNLQLGDIAAFSDTDGNYFHASVYLADNLVFGKNGNSPLSPWTIVPMDRLKGYYLDHQDDWNLTYYRRKDF
jgi:hypothetical protein